MLSNPNQGQQYPNELLHVHLEPADGLAPAQILSDTNFEGQNVCRQITLAPLPQGMIIF